MANRTSNRAKLDLLKGLIIFGTHTFKIILMKTGFAFDIDSHGVYADVSTNEYATTTTGYTTGGATLANISVTQDNALDVGKVTANNVSWTAASGSIGPCPGAIIYDDTHANDVIVGYIDFAGDKTVVDGGVFTISNIIIHVA